MKKAKHNHFVYGALDDSEAWLQVLVGPVQNKGKGTGKNKEGEDGEDVEAEKLLGTRSLPFRPKKKLQCAAA